MFFKDSVEIKKMPLKTAYDRSRDKTNNLKKLRDVVYSILESKGQKHTFIKVERGNVGFFFQVCLQGWAGPMTKVTFKAVLLGLQITAFHTENRTRLHQSRSGLHS